MLTRGWIVISFSLLGVPTASGQDDAVPPDEPSSFSRGSTRAARDAAQDVVNECESRGYKVEVKRGGPACRNWIHYEVHCKESSISNFARLACDEKDDFC